MTTLMSMDFKLSKEQKQLKKEIISFCRNYLNNDDSKDKFSYDMWKITSEMGIFGINMPVIYGGLEENYVTAAVIIISLGYGCENNGFVFAINNHIWVGLNLIYIHGSDYLKEKYLSDMVAGDCIGAIAITEANSGSDALSMVTIADKDGENYILNGNKMFISNGSIADVFIVFANVISDGKKKLTAFVVEKQTEGLTVGKDIERMGLNSCPMCEINFQNCIVPAKNILGTIENGNQIMMSALEWERCFEFACHVGAMQRVMEKCIKYANEREQFGKKIAEFQAVSHKIAEMKISIEMAELMLYKIAWLKDNKKSAYLESSVFKVFVSENYIKTCKDALQIFGAYGYTKEYNIECEMRDALACSIYSGTNEMQKNTIYNIAEMDCLV